VPHAQPLLDPALFVGAASLGVALQLIHVYLAPLKRTLQALHAVGSLTAIYLALIQVR
jgi:uncharacterized integral membrane protein